MVVVVLVENAKCVTTPGKFTCQTTEIIESYAHCCSADVNGTALAVLCACVCVCVSVCVCAYLRVRVCGAVACSRSRNRQWF